MPDLPDVNVWLSLAIEDHPHHARSRRYWTAEAAERISFCRVTELALLRLLSNERVLAGSALDGQAAWNALGAWLAAPLVAFEEEPDALEEILGTWAAELDIRGRHWTDAYLAAFAVASGSRLVSYDGDFARYPGLAWLHLTP